MTDEQRRRSHNVNDSISGWCRVCSGEWHFLPSLTWPLLRAYRDGDRLALISCYSIGLGGSDWRLSFDLGLERRGGPNEDGSGTIRRSRNTGTSLGDPGPTIE